MTPEQLLSVLADTPVRLAELARGRSAEGWSLTTVVTGAGRPLDTSVRSYADRLARHERAHVGQVARALAR